jgi:predicted enzyme related to lactoylglutathione lyase
MADEFTNAKHGAVCWRELATNDLAAASNFYQAMFGWKLEQSRLTPEQYSEIHFGRNAVGGMMQIDERWGQDRPPSHWLVYVAVDDLEDTAAVIRKNGGLLEKEPFDVAGVGRIGLVNDPNGAPFAIIQFERPAV